MRGCLASSSVRADGERRLPPKDWKKLGPSNCQRLNSCRNERRIYAREPNAHNYQRALLRVVLGLGLPHPVSCRSACCSCQPTRPHPLSPSMPSRRDGQECAKVPSYCPVHLVTEVYLRLSPCRSTEETQQRLISFAFLPLLLRPFLLYFRPTPSLPPLWARGGGARHCLLLSQTFSPLPERYLVCAVMIAVLGLTQNLEQLAWFPMLAASSEIFALVTK